MCTEVNMGVRVHRVIGVGEQAPCLVAVAYLEVGGHLVVSCPRCRGKSPHCLIVVAVVLGDEFGCGVG